MNEYWYLSKPEGLDEIGKKRKIISTKLIEFKVHYDKSAELYFATCNEHHFGVHAHTVEELKKNIEQTYHLVTSELMENMRDDA